MTAADALSLAPFVGVTDTGDQARPTLTSASARPALAEFIGPALEPPPAPVAGLGAILQALSA